MKVIKLLVLSWIVLSNSTGATELQTSKAVELIVPNLQVVDGSIEAINQSTIKALVNAKVKAIYVDVDDYVVENTLLVALDDTEIRTNLAQAVAGVSIAEAALVQAKTELKRLQDLKDSSFVSESALTAAQANRDKAFGQLQFYQAQVDESNLRLSYTKIIAPYSGVVVARHIEAGETALVGSPLLTGFSVNQNRVVANVPQRLIQNIEENKQIWVQKADKSWIGLSDPIIAPSANKYNHTVLVRANINKQEFSMRPGSFIKVGVDIGPKKILTIPFSSVIYQGDLVAVFVKQSNGFVLRQIRVGKNHDGQLEVISGLEKGDVIATNGSLALSAPQQKINSSSQE